MSYKNKFVNEAQRIQKLKVSIKSLQEENNPEYRKYLRKLKRQLKALEKKNE